jgi:uncharacterized protein involved in cysteine biosynthesis
MSKCNIIEEIRKLDIPAKAKAELLMLWQKAQKLVEAIIRFLQRHREFAHCMLLGAIIAWLLSCVPWIGGFLSLCALVTAAAIGVLKELREDIASLFEPIGQPA